MALPFLGHLHLLVKGLPHRVLVQLSKKHGPLFSLRLGSVSVVVASSSESAREVYKSFHSKPASISRRLLMYNQPDLVFAPYGDEWRQFRRICVLHLLTARRIEGYEDLRREELLQMINNILALGPGRTFNLRETLLHLSSNIITRMVMSKRYFGPSSDVADREEGAAFIRLAHEVFDIIGSFPIGEYLPLLRWLDLDGIESRYKKVAKEFDELMGQIIMEHQVKRQQIVATDGEERRMDFVDVLLELRDKGEEVLQGTNSIRAAAIDMILGGTDTSTVSIEWGMAELIKHPSVMAKLQEEVKQIVGESRLVKDADVQQMPYLQAVVKETLRLHPAALLVPPHSHTEDCTIKEYLIPAGTPVYINVHQIGRDPSVWQDPLEFKPERFLGSKIDVRGLDFELLPFGSGRRVCPGMLLALTKSIRP